jgi:hypothetical protein
LQEILSYYSKRAGRRDIDAIKIFCIGRNKTGTTSLASFFTANGYNVGNQEHAELLLQDWAKRDFRRIIEYCNSAEVFQDIPFSLPDTYRALDRAFPGSKFILSMRSTPEEWYNSLVAHHARRFSSTAGEPPSEKDLQQFKYRRKYKGWLFSAQQAIYGLPAVRLYDKQAYMAHYEAHNADVLDYFKSRPSDLLVVNLSSRDAFERLCAFVGLDPAQAAPLPHLNRSRDMRAA